MIDSAEYSLIGAILLNPACLDQVRQVVKPEDFRFRQSADIYRACCREADDGREYDQTIIENIPGIDPDYVRKLVDITVTAACVDRYAALVHERAVRARAVGIGAVLASMEDEDNCHDMVEQAVDCLTELMSGTGSSTISSSESLLKYHAWAGRRNEGKIRPVATGIPGVDDFLNGGMENGGLYILGARPGVGKSSVGLTIADNIARTMPVLYVTLEMPTEQLDARRVAMHAGMPIRDATGLFAMDDEEKWSKIGNTVDMLAKRKLVYNTCTSCTVSDIKLMAKQEKAGAVVIDYLGLLSAEGKYGSQYEKITQISGRLKQMALSLDVPVLALAQLNRNAAIGEPSLADLRDSGALEQDADSVIFLYRPDQSVKHANGEFQPLYFIVSKNRNGQTGRSIVEWNGETGRMRDNRFCWKSWAS